MNKSIQLAIVYILHVGFEYPKHHKCDFKNHLQQVCETDKSLHLACKIVKIVDKHHRYTL